MKIFSVQPNFGIGKINNLQNTTQNAPIALLKPMAADSVSFGAKVTYYETKVPYSVAEEVTSSLVSSTSGHRAPFNSPTFNKDVVQLLTLGVADYAKSEAKKSGKNPTVIIGSDTRDKRVKKEDRFLPLESRILTNQGIDVLHVNEPAPTPLLALLTQKEQVPIAILMTPSHNPWTDRGFNLLTPDGAVAPNHVTKEVGDLALEHAKKGYFTSQPIKGRVTNVNPYKLYKDTIDSYNVIDWAAIKDANIGIYYDGLQGTGDYVFPKLMKDNGIKFTNVKSGDHEGPNPNKANLATLAEKVQTDKDHKFAIGLANDGDADRFGIIDEKGNFITPNDVILLTAHHLHNNKGKTGAIIRSQATTPQLDIFARNNGLDLIQTPVGFKFIAEDIMKLREEGKDILVAGEESGGLTVNGHIPEKDGIIALLLMMDLIAAEQKPLSQILKDIKDDLNTNVLSTGFDVKVASNDQKEAAMDKVKDIYKNALNGNLDFAGLKIDLEKTKHIMEEMESYKPGGDGVNLYFEGGASLLVRKSGTEPKIKGYVTAINDDKALAQADFDKLKAAFDEIAQV